MNSKDVVTNVRGKATSKVSINRPNAKVKYQSGNRNKVLAERNQAVVPVGAWVEGGHDCMEHPVVLASLTEELQVEMRREKEENLRRFQDEVRRRVAQQAQVRKRRQLQKTFKTVERQRGILQHSGDSSQRFAPGKKLFPSSPQGELATCSPSAHWVVAQALERGDGEHMTADQPSQQHSKAMRQVRRRLAACQTVSDGEVMSELPGGLWNVSPTRDKPVSRMPRAEEEAEEEEEEEEDDLENEKEDEGDDSPLIRQHDCPLVKQNVDPYPGHKSVAFDSGPMSERVFEEPYHTGHVADRATQVLWPLDEQEELKRQRQSQFLLYRRLFMDIERERVQEHKRHRKHLRRIARIKKEKEQMRLEEERKMERQQQLQDARLEMEERELLVLERLRLEEEERAMEWEKRKLKKKEKEATRFIEALRAQMKERIAQEKVDLPPLCCCGDSFWDAHPDTCANNCTFYNNPKAYVQALQSALLSFDLKEGGGILQRAAHKMASMRSLSPRK